MAITQEFNGDILVDGNVSSDTITAGGAIISGAVSANSASISGAVSASGVSITGALSANTANINGVVTASYLGTTGNATNQTMSQLAVTNAINNAVTNALNRAHPVGTYYISDSATSPASLFGGSWQAINNRFLYATGKYSAGTTGGEESHVLSVSEMPQHNHDIRTLSGSSASSSNEYIKADATWNVLYQLSTASIGLRGNNQPHNNMPPFLVVNMWKRVA